MDRPQGVECTLKFHSGYPSPLPAKELVLLVDEFTCVYGLSLAPDMRLMEGFDFFRIVLKTFSLVIFLVQKNQS